MTDKPEDQSCPQGEGDTRQGTKDNSSASQLDPPTPSNPPKTRGHRATPKSALTSPLPSLDRGAFAKPSPEYQQSSTGSCRRRASGMNTLASRLSWGDPPPQPAEWERGIVPTFSS